MACLSIDRPTCSIFSFHRATDLLCSVDDAAAVFLYRHFSYVSIIISLAAHVPICTRRASIITIFSQLSSNVPWAVHGIYWCCGAKPKDFHLHFSMKKSTVNTLRSIYFIFCFRSVFAQRGPREFNILSIEFQNSCLWGPEMPVRNLFALTLIRDLLPFRSNVSTCRRQRGELWPMRLIMVEMPAEKKSGKRKSQHQFRDAHSPNRAENELQKRSRPNKSIRICGTGTELCSEVKIYVF